MSAYDVAYAAERAAWLAYVDYMDDLAETGWGDSTDQAERAAALLVLYKAWRDARDALKAAGGIY